MDLTGEFPSRINRAAMIKFATISIRRRRPFRAA